MNPGLVHGAHKGAKKRSKLFWLATFAAIVALFLTTACYCLSFVAVRRLILQINTRLSLVSLRYLIRGFFEG